MATKHVFISFVAEDLDVVQLFRGQAKNQNGDLSFDDYSVKVAYDSQDAPYIRAKIKEKILASSVLICLVGKDTSKSAWVNWEIRTANDMDKTIMGVRLASDRTDTLPAALTEVGGKVCSWNIASIVSLIG